MKKVDKLENGNEENFKRLVSVKRATVEVMLNEYKKAEQVFYPKSQDNLKNMLQ